MIKSSPPLHIHGKTDTAHGFSSSFHSLSGFDHCCAFTFVFDHLSHGWAFLFFGGEFPPTNDFSPIHWAKFRQQFVAKNDDAVANKFYPTFFFSFRNRHSSLYKKQAVLAAWLAICVMGRVFPSQFTTEKSRTRCREENHPTNRSQGDPRLDWCGTCQATNVFGRLKSLLHVFVDDDEESQLPEEWVFPLREGFPTNNRSCTSLCSIVGGRRGLRWIRAMLCRNT